MKKTAKFLVSAVVLGLSVIFASCNSGNVKGKVLGDYIVELPVVTEIDYDLGLKKDREHCGKGFGCSVVGKVLDDGDMVIGRSLDFFYSERPCYVIRTNVPGFLKTVGLAHNPLSGTVFEEVKKNGISKEELAGLLFFTTDILNEKGFYIEGNMRSSQPAETGIKNSTGTNPDAELTMSVVALIRYIGERASTVDEALEIAKSINVHGLMAETFTWGAGFFMADKSGHHGVLELVDDKLIWNEMQDIQTNFYLNSEYKDRAIIGSGLGRYKTLSEGYAGVRDEKDMQNLMAKVKYSQLFTPDTSEFDVRSEFSDETSIDGHMLTMEFVTAEENRDLMMKMLREFAAAEGSKSLEQHRKEGTQWYSSYQSIINCNKGTLRAVFYEDPSLTFDFTIE